MAGTPRFPTPALALTAVGLLLVAVYSVAWPGPFVFDDVSSIVENASLRSLSPWWTPLQPPIEGGLTVAGRPLLNLSFALNHGLLGSSPGGFRAVNLAIHFGAALLLFGVVRRAWRWWRPTAGVEADWIAVASAALWSLHPLATIAVTYVVQRAESLAAFWVLLTLYGFIRSTEAGANVRAWRIVSWSACLAGMATKETAAAAPLLVGLVNRTLIAGSFTAAWRQRRAYYAALASTWLLLGWLVWSSGGRGGSAGVESAGSSWHYALTQAGAIAHYVRLVAWPSPLVFDYGNALATDPLRVALPGLFVLALLAATSVALARRSALGLLGAWFFLLLAPSSSVVPVATQTMGEHRMYLPLVAPVILVVGWIGMRAGRRAWIPLLVLVLAAAQLSALRNIDYRDARTLWGGVVAHAPENSRGHLEYGSALAAEGKLDAALAAFAEAVRLKPDSWKAYNNWGDALRRLGRMAEAQERLQRAHELAPHRAEPLINLGNLFLASNRFADAGRSYRAAIARRPDSALAYFNLGCAYAAQRRFAEAETAFREAVRLRPQYAEARLALEKVRKETAATKPGA